MEQGPNIATEHDAEAKQPEITRQVWERADIAQDPNPGLFMFVSHWSENKGVDLIADFMEMYPDCIPSKPQSTALPPYLFIGADFTPISPHNESSSLVAVASVVRVPLVTGGLGLVSG